MKLTNLPGDGPAMVAGLEIGGTKLLAVRGHCAPGGGAVIAERVVIPTTTPDQTLGKAVEVLREWHRDHGLQAIGVAAFGPVRIDPAQNDYGCVLATPKPGWQGADLLAPLREFRVPLALDTDVNAAALAELALGAGQGCRSLVYLTIGTGVGGGIVIDGRSVHGALHPELGHMMLRRTAGDAFAGVCPFHGDCIEGLISGPALRARFGEDAGAVAADDPRWDAVSVDLGRLIANLVLALSPEKIVIGGGVGIGQRAMVRRAAERVPELLAGYCAEIDASAMPQLVVAPALGHDAGPLGAIMLAAKALEKC